MVQLLVESAVIAALGAAVGVALSSGSVGVLGHVAPQSSGPARRQVSTAPRWRARLVWRS